MKRNLTLTVAALIIVLASGLWYISSQKDASVSGGNTPNAALLQDLAKGDVSNFTISKTPKPVSDLPFADGKGNAVKLSDFKGRLILVNFWATWCAPCRHEMPSLDALQASLGAADFEVVAISLDRGGLPAASKFLGEVKAQNLGVYVDSKNRIGREMGAFGLPLTVLIGRQGQEIGRMAGPAQWDSPDAQALIRAAIAAKL